LAWNETLRAAEPWENDEEPENHFSIEELQDEQRQILSTLSGDLGRVVDAFRPWEGHIDGRISKKEFRRVMKSLIKKAEIAVIDSIFVQFDRTRTGIIEFAEFYQALRNVLQAGAADANDVAHSVRHSVRSSIHMNRQGHDGKAPPPSSGTLLSRKAFVFALGPSVQQANHLCQKLAENFDGKVITVASLADREVKLNSHLSADVKKARTEGSGALGSFPTSLVVPMLQGLAESGTGPFFLQGIPRSLEELRFMEARKIRCRLAIEIVVTGVSEMPATTHIVQEFAGRKNLVMVNTSTEVTTILKQVESRLTDLRQEEYLEWCERRERAQRAGDEAKREKREKLEEGAKLMAANRTKALKENARQLALKQQQQEDKYRQSLEEKLAKIHAGMTFEQLSNPSFYDSFLQSTSSYRKLHTAGARYQGGGYGVSSEGNSHSMPRLNPPRAPGTAPSTSVSSLDGGKLPTLHLKQTGNAEYLHSSGRRV